MNEKKFKIENQKIEIIKSNDNNKNIILNYKLNNVVILKSNLTLNNHKRKIKKSKFNIKDEIKAFKNDIIWTIQKLNINSCTFDISINNKISKNLKESFKNENTK